MPAHTDDDPRATPAPDGQPPTGDGADASQAGTDAPQTGWRRWLPRRRPAPTAGGAAEGAGAAADAADGDEAAQPTEAIAPPPQVEGAGRLRRRRRKLLTRREEAVYHLGGLAFELYRRDMLGEEVMRRRAGEVALLDDTVRDIDARLGELDRERRERRRRAEPDAPAGNCLDCRAPFRAEARFCWQCGARLVPDAAGDEQVTAVISARPAPADAEPRRGEDA